jgi:uncharacterized protein YndB with AHSA1/START domain
MLIQILIALAVLIGIFVIIVALRPADFRISRSAKIPAPPSVVFRQVNDFHLWPAWSPWAKLDPDCKNIYEGAAAGVGARFAWSGNGKVGAGRMTIVESRPGEFIRLEQNFEKPFQGHNYVEFTFKPEGRGTLMTWTTTGKNKFMAKAVMMVLNCDKMVGGEFEQGLANLKEVAAAAAKASRL